MNPFFVVEAPGKICGAACEVPIGGELGSWGSIPASQATFSLLKFGEENNKKPFAPVGLIVKNWTAF